MCHVGPVIDPPRMEQGDAEVDLVPAQVANLRRPEPVPKGDQYHGGVPVAISVDLGGLDQGVDFASCQVLAGAKLGVRSPCRSNCSENLSWGDQMECRICQ